MQMYANRMYRKNLSNTGVEKKNVRILIGTSSVYILLVLYRSVNKKKKITTARIETDSGRLFICPEFTRETTNTAAKKEKKKKKRIVFIGR